jgi:hypothetical protein
LKKPKTKARKADVAEVMETEEVAAEAALVNLTEEAQVEVAEAEEDK